MPIKKRLPDDVVDALGCVVVFLAIFWGAM